MALALAGLAKLAIPAGLALLFASGAKKTGKPQTMQGMLLVGPNGVVIVDPRVAPWVLQSLQNQFVVPSGNALFEEVALSETGGPGYTPALVWAQAKAAAGKIVLILINGGKGLAAVQPGQEVALCQRSAEHYAVLLEPPALPVGVPGGGGVPGVSQGPNGPAVTIPGVGTIPLPNFNPGAQGGSQGGTVPGSYTPHGPSSPSSPENPFPSLPNFGPGSTPGTVNVPGIGDVQIPQIPGFGGSSVPAPPGPGGTPPVGLPSSPASGQVTFLGPDGLWRHTIRPGDIASRLAQWYRGNALAWRELEQTNPNLQLVLQGGQPLGYNPWRVGQVLVLPTGWDGSKGPPVSTVNRVGKPSATISGWR